VQRYTVAPVSSIIPVILQNFLICIPGLPRGACNRYWSLGDIGVPIKSSGYWSLDDIPIRSRGYWSLGDIGIPIKSSGYSSLGVGAILCIGMGW